MNKLLTFAGVMPVYLGDLDWMQDAYLDASLMLVRTLMDSNVDNTSAILQGVELSQPVSGQIAWTEGIVALNGELLRIDEGAITAGRVDNLYFHVVSVLSGTRTFKDGQDHACHEERKATISSVASGGVPVTSVKRLNGLYVSEYNSITNNFAPSAVAHLKKRSGLWFFDTPVEVAPAAAAVGNATFSVSAEDFSKIQEMTFQTTIIIMNSGGEYNQVIVNVTINKDQPTASTRVVEIVFDFANEDFDGEGDIRMMLPIF